jgi:hypothetical protein
MTYMWLACGRAVYWTTLRSGTSVTHEKLLPVHHGHGRLMKASASGQSMTDYPPSASLLLISLVWDIKLKGPVVMAKAVENQGHDLDLQLVKGPVMGDGTTMSIYLPLDQNLIRPDPGTSVTLMLFASFLFSGNIVALALEEKTVRDRFTRLGIVYLQPRTPAIVRDGNTYREMEERHDLRPLVNDWINSIPLRELEIF